MKLKFIILLAVLLGSSNTNGQTIVPLWKTLPVVPPMPKADESGLAL